MKHILIITMLVISMPACSNASQKSILVLEEYTGKSYSQVIEILGPPMRKGVYTIQDAPTKSWHHGELFSKYPKIPKNENILILEATWDAGDYRIHACFHLDNGVNRCLVAKKIHKGVRF